MKVLFLFSPLRSGSNMVRSMLRDDKSIWPAKMEHLPIIEGGYDMLLSRPGTTLRPVKFGNFPAGIDACLASAETPQSCALILYRRDWKALAASYFVARANRSWFGETNDMRDISVDWKLARTIADRIQDNLETLQAKLDIPFQVLAYEDIDVTTVKSALDTLLGRDVTVVEPLTRKINSARFVTNLSEAK